MKISERAWKNFITRLAKIDKAAADYMRAYIAKRGGFSKIKESDLIDCAYGIVAKYGEASAALSAEMYDAIAELSGVRIPPAVVADTAPYAEVARAIRGAAQIIVSEITVINTVARLVKRAGADTMLKNAIRDGAEFAWIPSGDSCAFCITLASNGWRKASEKALKGGHAEHIHANCDCAYAVRFNSETSVAGYDPDIYREMYYGAEGSTSHERINSLRRELYAENADEINAQKREAYARRKEALQGSE